MPYIVRLERMFVCFSCLPCSDKLCLQAAALEPTDPFAVPAKPVVKETTDLGTIWGLVVLLFAYLHHSTTGYVHHCHLLASCLVLCLAVCIVSPLHVQCIVSVDDMAMSLWKCIQRDCSSVIHVRTALNVTGNICHSLYHSLSHISPPPSLCLTCTTSLTISVRGAAGMHCQRCCLSSAPTFPSQTVKGHSSQLATQCAPHMNQ
jgi:hypothetical protein